jgi:hypothetical protein
MIVSSLPEFANAPECPSIGVLKEASTDTDNLESPTRKKKNATQALKIISENEPVEWLWKSSSKALKGKGLLHQGETRTP